MLLENLCYSEHTSLALVLYQSPGQLFHSPSVSKKTQVDGEELLVLETDAIFWCVFLFTSL